MTDLISRAAVLEILRTPAASDTFPDMIRRVEALEGCGVRIKALEDFVADFASAKIDALRYQPAYGESPEDEPDPVVDAETVWAWQADAKTALAALEPVAQPETPTPGQFTTMCLAIEDVVTGRGFDVDPWQPIETAQRPPVQSPIVEAILAYWPGGFIESVYWADGWWPTAYDAERPWNEPTHWMPLPKPPGETTSAIPDAVKAYLRNALMVGGWRGERD